MLDSESQLKYRTQEKLKYRDVLLTGHGGGTWWATWHVQGRLEISVHQSDTIWYLNFLKNVPVDCWLILCLGTWGMKRPRRRLLEATAISCYWQSSWGPLKELTFSLLNSLATASPALHLVHIWHGFHCLFHLGCTSLNRNFMFSLQFPWFCQPWLLMPTVQAIKRLWKSAWNRP